MQPNQTLTSPKIEGIYTAELTQISTDDPTVNVLQNTLSADITWTRSGVGDYIGTLTGAFPEGLTYIPGFGNDNLRGIFYNLPFDYGYTIKRTGNNTIRWNVYKTSDGSDAEWSSLSPSPIIVQIIIYKNPSTP